MKNKGIIFLILSLLLISCNHDKVLLTGEWIGVGSAKYQVDYQKKISIGTDTLISIEKKDSIVLFKNLQLYLAADTFIFIGLDNPLHGKAIFQNTIHPQALSIIDLINHDSYEYEVAVKELELEKNGTITIDVNAENAILGEQFEFNNDTLNVWFTLGRSTDNKVEYNLKFKKK